MKAKIVNGPSPVTESTLNVWLDDVGGEIRIRGSIEGSNDEDQINRVIGWINPKNMQIKLYDPAITVLGFESSIQLST